MTGIGKPDSRVQLEKQRRVVTFPSGTPAPANGENHKCFGCGKQIADYEEHIHVGLDEWIAAESLGDGLGLDDLLTFPFCSECIKTSDRGWQPESHEVLS